MGVPIVETARLYPAPQAGCWIAAFYIFHGMNVYDYMYNAGSESLTEHEAYGILVSTDALKKIYKQFLHDVILDKRSAH